MIDSGVTAIAYESIERDRTLPYAIKLVDLGIKALEIDLALAMGLNVNNYQLVHPPEFSLA